MCNHEKYIVNDVIVCIKCGLMVTKKGEFIGFDKELYNYLQNRQKGKKAVK